MGTEMNISKLIVPKTTQDSLQWVRENVKIPGTLDAADSQNGKENAGKEQRATDAFGEVHFIGATRTASGQYVRVGNTTKAETAYTLMIDHWRMDEPYLIISVTGGTKSFNLDPRLKKQFATGLLKSAESPGAWVITGGTNTGVMKHVGEALKGATKACIGIATWGSVHNRKALIENEDNRKNRTFEEKFDYNVSSGLNDRSAFLDHNHTHFLLVDDGSSESNGKEDFRSRLETLFVKREVPSVLLVLEGGPDTLDTIKGSLDSKVPVVLIKHSGGVADLLATILETLSEHNMEAIRYFESIECYIKRMLKDKLPANPKQTEEENINKFERMPKDKLPANPKQTEEENINKFERMPKDKLPANPKQTEEENINKYYKVVDKCLKQRELITVFDMDSSSSSLDELILTAMLNKISAPSCQLHFTLMLNRPDLAENELLTKDNTWEIYCEQFNKFSVMYQFKEEKYFNSQTQNINKWDPQWHIYKSGPQALQVFLELRSERQDKDMTYAMIFSLVRNRVQFVKLFLDYGMSLEYILNKEILQFLYGACANPSNSILHAEIDDALTSVVKKPIPSAEFKKFMEKICNDVDLDINRSSVAWSSVEQIINDLCSDIRQGRVTKKLLLKCPYHELFLWAVLNGMHDMALMLWQFKEEGLMKALIAAEINNKLAEKAAGIANLSDEVEKSFADNAKDFQNLAVQLLEEIYKANKKKAMKLITKKSCRYYGQTCLQVAVISNHLKFVSHSSVQALLNDVFTGPIKASLINIPQYLLAMVFPPYLLSFNFRTEHELKELATTYEQLVGILLPAAVDATDESLKMSSFKKLMLFYFKTPCVKFYNNVVAYIIFLALISFVALEEKKSMPSSQEFIVIAFVVSFTFEEINQFFQCEFKSVTARVKKYLSSNWNLVDIFANVLFYVALGLRLKRSTEHFGKMLYAFDAAIWILRLLQVFYVHKIMGPYVVMIYRMFVDMMYFLTILVVFMVAYGVCASAIIDKHDNAVSMLSDVFFRSYFNIYGELFIDRDPESSDVTRFGYPVINKYAEPVGCILLGSYLLIANVLLLNLLIAIFGDTFTKVQDNASQIWKFERYKLILEYTNRPPLVPPFILLAHIYSFFKWLIKSCPCLKNKITDSKPLISVVKEREMLNKLESDCLASLLRSRTADHDAGKGSVSHTVERMKDTKNLLLNNEDLLKLVHGIKNVKKEELNPAIPRAIPRQNKKPC